MTRTIDTESLKRDHPITEVIGRYGIELRPSGRALVGRCPFHPDGGRPNLHVYPATQSWYCYRCGVGGDAIAFVRRLEGCDFRRAVARIAGGELHATVVGRHLAASSRPAGHLPGSYSPAERACLAAAVELYHNRLLGDLRAFAYVRGRGIDRQTVQRCRVGYAAGGELAAYLRWRRLPLRAAVRVGLLTPGGREFFAGRVVVPEVRGGQPIWLIGRTLDPVPAGPRYLGLPGPKPLLGWEEAAKSPTVWLTEGVFDWLALVAWGLPALALVGTYARTEALRALARFERIYLALDADDAGRQATAAVAGVLGGRAVSVTLPGVKDVSELAALPNGRVALLRAAGARQLARAA